MTEKFFGRTREEFIDFMSDMLIDSNQMANDILNQYFGAKTLEDWDIRTDIMAAWYAKRDKNKQTTRKLGK